MLRRPIFLLSTLFAILILAGAFDYAAVRADDANAWAILPANLRSEPGQQGAVLTVLESSTPVVMEARNSDASWLLVHSAASGARGWSKTTLFKIAPGIKLYSLPVSTEVIPVGSTAPGASNNTTAPPAPATNAAMPVCWNRNRAG